MYSFDNSYTEDISSERAKFTPNERKLQNQNYSKSFLHTKVYVEAFFFVKRKSYATYWKQKVAMRDKIIIAKIPLKVYGIFTYVLTCLPSHDFSRKKLT